MTTSLSSPDSPEYFQSLSLKVYQILEDIGASVAMRTLRMETNGIRETLESLTFSPSVECNICGSSYEGTTTLGMSSDVDNVLTFNAPVVTDLIDHPVGACLLMIQDETTPPGYCKLQLAYDGHAFYRNTVEALGFIPNFFDSVFKFCLDKKNRLVCLFEPRGIFPEGCVTRHGPALSRNGSSIYHALDLVAALHCSSWPKLASEWLTRKRHYNWPSARMIDQSKRSGCLFVPVGHPESDEKQLLWRVSFSHPERLLVTDFYLKCYVLLKIVKKELIAPDIQESLSSYHLKTCILYLIENTSVEFWRPNNLLGCVAVSLKMISQWVENGNCPNYFIPAESMFDRHVHRQVRRRLHRRLQQLISADCKFLADIKTDDIGAHLQFQCMPVVTETLRQDSRNVRMRLNRDQQHTKFEPLVNQADYVFSYSARFVRSSIGEDIETSLVTLYRKMGEMGHSDSLTNVCFTDGLLQKSVRLVLPYKELTCMSWLIALAVKQGKRKEQIWPYLASDKWQHVCSQYNTFSAKLKQASFMFMQGYYHPSLEILYSICNLKRYTLCLCNFENPICPSLESFAKIPDVTIEGLMRKVFVPCVYFTPIEKDITPTALCYEMIRTNGPTCLRIAPREKYNSHDEMFNEWAFVDAQFLLHFLLCLNHTEINMVHNASSDIANMKRLLNSQNISHRETCFNLLGWLYKEKGQIDRAMECFRRSTEIKPYWNAAFWHMKDIENV